MAERVPPLPEHPPPQPDQPSSSPPQPHQHQPLFSSGTYVVQVPKDLIYRTPPPENALIVERHRNPAPADKKRSPFCRCLCVFAAVASVAVVLGVLAAVLVPVLVRPKDPKFHVDKIKVRGTGSRREYDVRLLLEDSGSFSFPGGGRASLSFGKQEIAAGKYPVSRRGAVGLVLRAKPHVMLPVKIEKSLKSNETKVLVSLSLKMDLPARISGERDVELVVVCGFTVDTLAEGSRILTQKCESSH